MIQSKKRKQAPTSTDNDDEQMLDNFELVLFDEMTTANGQLLSIGNKFNLVDNLYFVNNCEMIAEFIGNVNHFLNKLEHQKKKVAFSNLNSDILSHVYKFLNTRTLKNCGLVSKLWRTSLVGLKVVVRNNSNDFVNCSLVNHVSELKIEFHSSHSNCFSFNQLKVLNLCCYCVSSTKFIDWLKKLHVPQLIDFKLSNILNDETATTNLLNSNFMKSIKKLNLSIYLRKGCLQFISESKCLDQVTHLRISGGWDKIENLNLLLNKVNLESLEMKGVHLKLFNDTSLTLMNLTYIKFAFCVIRNQEFANLITSPILPNLSTLEACEMNFSRRSGKVEVDETIAVFPLNSQSSITKLNLTEFNPKPFQSLLHHLPKLKNLKIETYEKDDELLEVLYEMIKSPKFINLEILEIEYKEEIMEHIFTSPTFSNLKELYLRSTCGEYKAQESILSIISKSNLVNLTSLNLNEFRMSFKVLLELEKELKNNPTFAKLNKIKLPQRCFTEEEEEDDDN